MKIKFGNVTFECCSVCPCGKLGLTRFDPEMGDVVDVYCLALNEITHKMLIVWVLPLGHQAKKVWTHRL